MLAVETRSIPVHSVLGSGPLQQECRRGRGPHRLMNMESPLGCRSWGWSIGAKPDQLGHPSGAHRLLVRDSGCGVEPTALHSRACRALQRRPLSLRPAVACFWADGTVPQMAVTIPIRYKTPVNLLRCSGPQQAALPRCFWGRRQEASLPCLFGRNWTANSCGLLEVARWRRCAIHGCVNTEHRPMFVILPSCRRNFTHLVMFGAGALISLPSNAQHRTGGRWTADGRWQQGDPMEPDGVGSCQAGPSFVGVVHSIFQVTALHHQPAESTRGRSRHSQSRHDNERQETTTPKFAGEAQLQIVDLETAVGSKLSADPQETKQWQVRPMVFRPPQSPLH